MSKRRTTPIERDKPKDVLISAGCAISNRLPWLTHDTKVSAKFQRTALSSARYRSAILQTRKDTSETHSSNGKQLKSVQLGLGWEPTGAVCACAVSIFQPSLVSSALSWRQKGAIRKNKKWKWSYFWLTLLKPNTDHSSNEYGKRQRDMPAPVKLT